MSDTKLVGAVGIKIRPVAKGFRRETERKVKEAAKNIQADIDLNPELAEEAKRRVKAGAKRLVKEAEAEAGNIEIDVKTNKRALDQAVKELKDKGKVEFTYSPNRRGVEKALAELDALIAKHGDIKIPVGTDRKSLKDFRDNLERSLKNQPLEISMHKDERGWQKLIDDLKARRRDLESAAKFTVEPDELKSAAGMQRAIDRARAMAKGAKVNVDIDYTNDFDSIDAAIIALKDKLKSFEPKITIDADMDESQVRAKIAELEKERLTKTIHLEYDENEAGLRAAKAKLEELLGHKKNYVIDTTLDKDKLLAELAKVDLALKAYEPKPKIKPEVSKPAAVKAEAEIGFLTRDRIMNIRAHFIEGSLFTFGKLTGLRAATRYTQEFARAIGTMDRNLPVVAAVTTGIAQLSSGVLALGSNVFALGASLAQIGYLGLLGPALLGGLVSVATVLTGVFKDFGAAVNGDERALKRLSPAGKEAAAAIGPIFAEMRESISRNFWDGAADGMLRFTRVALPAFKTGFDDLSISMGRGFSGILDSFNKFAEQGGLTTQFRLLAAGFELANKGTQNFWEALQTLGLVGSRVFPRLGQAFTDVSQKFNDWVQRIAADGTMSRWIDRGIENLKSLGRSFIEAGKVWSNFAQAAEAAGGLTLSKLAAGLKVLDDVTSTSRFQRNMQTVFEGAHQAMGNLFDALGKLGPTFDTFSGTIKNILVGSSEALSSAIGVIGRALASPAIDKGFGAFLGGLQKMFDALAPSAESLASIIGTLGDLLGTVATDAGPLFRTLFQQLATVFNTAWTELRPFVSELTELGTQVLRDVGPALNEIAKRAVPIVGKAFEMVAPQIENASGMLKNFVEGLSKIKLGTVFEKTIGPLFGTRTKEGKSFWDGIFQMRPEDEAQAQRGASQILGALMDGLRSGDANFDRWITDFKGKFLNIGNREVGALQPLSMLTDKQVELGRKSEEAARGLLEASRAAEQLRDTTRDGATQVDIMRQALANLRSGDAASGLLSARDAAAEMTKHMAVLKEEAAALQPELAKLDGGTIFKDGLLNIESGNKAVLTLRDTLRSASDDVLGHAKSVYNTAIQNGDTVEIATQKAMAAVKAGDANLAEIASAAGLTVDQLRGEWETFFGKDWELKAIFTGSNEQFKIARQEALELGIQFDGQEFWSFLMADGNPANETKEQVEAHMRDYANKKWDTTLGALPEPAQEQIRQLAGMTNEQWVNHDWVAVMRAAETVPGLGNVLGQILNVKNGDYTAIVKAIADVLAAQAQIQAVANARYTAWIDVKANMPDLNGAEVSGNGRWGGIARGGILDALGRGLHGFSPAYHAFANGGFESHIAQIARPGVMPRVWAERETGGEAYIPYALSKRGRSSAILARVASDFGYQLVKRYADGGAPTPAVQGPSYNAPVHIGQLITTDPDAAVSALKRKQRDAQAVANIKPF